MNIKGLNIRTEIVCWKIKSNIKEKITGFRLCEPIPIFSGVNKRINVEKKIILLALEGKKLEII